MNTTSRRIMAVVATTTFSLTAGAVAAIVGLAPLAHAEPDYQQFTSPSGNIKCEMTVSYKGDPYANCVARHAGFAVLTPECDSAGSMNPQIGLTQGGRPEVSCVVASDAPAEFTLHFGQRRSVGAITCDSEEAGVTCTDTGTGHFFRISPQSYDLG
jgi:hypothetical protein